MAPLPNALTTLLSRSTLDKRYYYYTTYYFPVGAIVGIVIVVILIILVLIGVCVRRSRRNRGAVPYQPQPYNGGGAPGAVGYNQSGYAAGNYPQYGPGAAVPSQYGQQPQTESKYQTGGPIQSVPPVYSGPGTFYGNTHNTNNDQTGIVR